MSLTIHKDETIKEVMEVASKTDLGIIRHISNYIVRSSLCSINAEKYRDMREKRDLICSDSKFELSYDGYRLGQDDFDVFQVISNLWYLNDKQEHIFLSKYELAKCLLRPQKGNTYKLIMESLSRLASSTFKCKINDYKFVGALLTYVEHASGKLKFSFNQELMNLLAIDNESFQDYEIRRNLDGDLTKWLYNFYSTHSQYQFHKLVTLKSYCGAESENKYFKKSLIESLNQLKEKKLIHSYSLSDTRSLENLIIKVTPKQIKPTEDQVKSLNVDVDTTPSSTIEFSTRIQSKKVVKKGTGRGKVAL